MLTNVNPKEASQSACTDLELGQMPQHVSRGLRYEFGNNLGLELFTKSTDVALIPITILTHTPQSIQTDDILARLPHLEPS